jgi:hypothetical protein
LLTRSIRCRQVDRDGGVPLHDAVRRWFRQMVQRVAALLALGPQAEGLSQAAIEGAFTAFDLGIRR